MNQKNDPSQYKQHAYWEGLQIIIPGNKSSLAASPKQLPAFT
jgi:hypothetical protein